MFAAWTVGINLVTRSNFGLVAANISRQAAAAEGSVGKLHNRMGSIQAASKLATGAFIGLGVVAGAAMLKGVEGAATLETAMVSIRNATGATHYQMEQLRAKAFEVSALTAQSVTDSARIMKVMATAGINDPKQLMAIAKPAALFADVQFLSRGVSFEDGAKQAIQLAHLYQAYTPEKITPVLNNLTKLSQMMPDNLNRYLTQAGYYMPVFRRLGVSDDQSLVAGAFLDRMGLGRGKGGTGLQNFILNQMQSLTMTGHMQKGRKTALGNLGLINPDGSAKYYRMGQDGKPHFDVIGSLEAINAAVERRTHGKTGHARELAEGRAIIDIQKALNVQGGRIGFLGTPEALKQLHQMIGLLHDPRFAGMVEQQRRYMDTVAGQFQLFRTNVASLLTDAMWGALPTIKKYLGDLAEAAHRAQVWVHKHRDATQKIVIALTAAVGASIALGAYLAGNFMLSVLSASRSVNVLAASVVRLGVASGESAATQVAAGAAAGRTSKAFGLLSIAMDAVPIAALAAAIGGLYAKAIQEGNKRLESGTNSTENEQYGRGGRGYRVHHDFDASGNPILPGRAPEIPGIGAKKVGAINIHVNASYHAPHGASDAQARRSALEHARAVANETARVVASVARTSMRAATGVQTNPLGMSNLEFNPSMG